MPFLSWGGLPPTTEEYLPAPSHPRATVITFTSGKNAVSENDGASFHASATSPSKAVEVF